jgi:hypothetical protein
MSIDARKIVVKIDGHQAAHLQNALKVGLPGRSIRQRVFFVLHSPSPFSE